MMTESQFAVMLFMGAPAVFAALTVIRFAPDIIEHFREIRTKRIISEIEHNTRVFIAREQATARLEREIGQIKKDREKS